MLNNALKDVAGNLQFVASRLAAQCRTMIVVYIASQAAILVARPTGRETICNHSDVSVSLSTSEPACVKRVSAK